MLKERVQTSASAHPLTEGEPRHQEKTPRPGPDFAPPPGTSQDDTQVVMLSENEAVTIKKVDPAQVPLEALIDEYGDLDSAIKAFNKGPVVERFNEVKKVLFDRLDEGLKDHEGYKTAAKHFAVERSPKSKVREVTNLRGLMEYLGVDDFLSICNVKLSDVDQYIPEEDHDQFLEVKENAGQRKLKLIKLDD